MPAEPPADFVPTPPPADLLERLVSLGKQRGFFFPSSEIYGGINALYDYGPLGTRLRRNIRNRWWRSTVELRDDIEGIETSVIMNPAGLGRQRPRRRLHRSPRGLHRQLPQALARRPPGCRACRPGGRPRAPGCPECGGALTEPRQFNLMFRTFLGPVEDTSAQVYLRPETAQGMFVDFKSVLASSRRCIPFGIAQIGKSFRNEISPGNFIFRTREFEQMEMEFFCEPGTDERLVRLLARRAFPLVHGGLGVRADRLRLRDHAPKELAHYAKAATDVEYLYPFGWGELEGIANRTDFDLSAHQKASGVDLSYFDQATGKRFIPYVIEPAAGVDRIMLTVLIDAYDEEDVRGEKRTVLRMHPDVAPVQVAVLPLSKKEELTVPARLLEHRLRPRFATDYDETQAIGRRYRRQDEIGTPLAVTYDFDSVTDEAVTIRERDGMTQVRVPISGLEAAIQDQLVLFRKRTAERAAAPAG